MRLLLYTLFRLGLVLAAAGLLYLLGMRSWVLWITAVIVGALVSFLVLGRQREEAAEVLAQYDPLRAERPTFSPEVEADAAYEDAIVDAASRRTDENAPVDPGTRRADENAAVDPGNRHSDDDTHHGSSGVVADGTSAGGTVDDRPADNGRVDGGSAAEGRAAEGRATQGRATDGSADDGPRPATR